MKELSVEEKARRYDEAIEVAREYWNSPRTCIDINVLPKLFPELKESEDESVRKWIRKELESKYVVDNIVNNMMADKAFAWLEKQGAELSVYQNVLFKIATILSQHEDKEDSPLEQIRSIVVDGLVSAMDIDKQGEQKPEEIVNLHDYLYGEQKPAWSEEDETTRNNISHIIRQYDKISKRENKPCWYIGNCLLWMQNIKDRVQPLPNQEWSNWDKTIIESIEALCDEKIESVVYQDVKEHANDIKEWLKKLKDRVLLQPKQEWSEEEQQAIEDAETWLDTLCDYLKDSSSECIPVIKELISKLKSLRPQKQWKPSDEHYELEEFAKIVRGNLTGISKAVQELFEAKYQQLTGNKMY